MRNESDIKASFESYIPFGWMAVGSFVIVSSLVSLGFVEEGGTRESIWTVAVGMAFGLLILFLGLRALKSPYVRFYADTIVLYSGSRSNYIPIDLIEKIEKKKRQTVFLMFDGGRLSIDHGIIASKHRKDFHSALNELEEDITSRRSEKE